MTRQDARLALVIGATGGVGGAVAERLVAEGWRVRAMNRDPDAARVGRETFDWVKGDAMVEADVVAAAEGVSLIVHGANPPGYKNWAGVQLPMLSATIAAAKASGARIVFPGTVYNYGPDAFPSIDEASAQNPVTRKGAIRVQMEQALRQAANDGVKVLIVRAGDFFGPKPGNNWLSQGLVKPGKPVAAVTYPGPLSIPHCWAYLPDVAEIMVRLATNLPHARADLDRRRDGRGAVRGRGAQAAGPPPALDRHQGHVAVQRDHARDAGDALPLGAPGAAGQRQAGRAAWRGAAHADRRGVANRPRRHGRPAPPSAEAGGLVAD
jgi:nucleoside-diphosphate-sugar epimerase